MTGYRRVLLALAAILAVGGCGAPSVDEMVPAFSRPQGPQDRLPAFKDGTKVEGVDADSTRYLGKTDAAEYWVGRQDEEVCLVLSLVGAETVGSSCATAAVFAESGLWVFVSTSSVSAAGLLVPKGFDLSDAPADRRWVEVSDNLAASADEVR